MVILQLVVKSTDLQRKAKNQPQNVNYGLVGYPVLMTADIILYKGLRWFLWRGPVAPLELAREITRRFNTIFGNTFLEPQAKLTTFPLVVGLNGTQKMGKSYDNHVELAATPEETTKKIMSAVTDPARQYRSDPGHPDICNVFKLHQYFTPGRLQEISVECCSARIGCVDCKKILAQSVNLNLAPFRERRAQLTSNPKSIYDIMSEGAQRARAIAKTNIAGSQATYGADSTANLDCYEWFSVTFIT